jgi:hypothetical protein
MFSDRKEVSGQLKGLVKVYTKFRSEDNDSLVNILHLLGECTLLLIAR